MARKKPGTYWINRGDVPDYVLDWTWELRDDNVTFNSGLSVSDEIRDTGWRRIAIVCQGDDGKIAPGFLVISKHEIEALAALFKGDESE